MWYSFLRLRVSVLLLRPCSYKDNSVSPNPVFSIWANDFFQPKIKYLRHRSFQSAVAFQWRASERLSFCFPQWHLGAREVATVKGRGSQLAVSRVLLVSSCSPDLPGSSTWQSFQHPDHFCNLCMYLWFWDSESMWQVLSARRFWAPSHFPRGSSGFFLQPSLECVNLLGMGPQVHTQAHASSAVETMSHSHSCCRFKCYLISNTRVFYRVK